MISDRTKNAQFIEARLPFFDPRIVEFAYHTWA
jgi:hypothetical protein